MDTKALRQKVLDLAIRGKLVPQDPNDEPASVLLERIRQQKQQMVKEGKLKAKDIKNDSIIFVGEDNLHYEKFADGSVKCIEDEIPFELPDGWAWCRLLSIIEEKPTNGYSPKGVEYITDVRNLTLTATTSGYFKPSEFKYVDVKIASDSKYWLKNGDILIQRSNSRELVGTSCIYEGEDGAFIYPDLMMRIHLMSGIDVKYVDSVLKSKLTRGYYIENATGSAGSMPKINQAIVANTLIPLPPCAEQNRLAQHLDQLMNIIYCIEVGKSDILGLISKTKSKVLDLAIRGQLVPQDPADEPASVLLERIRAEKEELIKQGKIKRDKKESVIFRGEDNSYYLRTGELVESLEDWAFEDLPDSWSVCCLGDLCDYGNCTNVDTADIDDSAWMLDLEDIEKDSGVVLQKVRKAERNAASTKHRFHKGQVLYSKLRPYLNKVVLADEDGYCTSEILPLEFERNILPQYARYYLMSPAFLRYANKCSYGVKMPRLGTADGKKAIISIPPFEEQKRIVLAIELAFSQLVFISESLA